MLGCLVTNLNHEFVLSFFSTSLLIITSHLQLSVSASLKNIVYLASRVITLSFKPDCVSWLIKLFLEIRRIFMISKFPGLILKVPLWSALCLPFHCHLSPLLCRYSMLGPDLTCHSTFYVTWSIKTCIFTNYSLLVYCLLSYLFVDWWPYSYCKTWLKHCFLRRDLFGLSWDTIRVSSHRT